MSAVLSIRLRAPILPLLAAAALLAGSTGFLGAQEQEATIQQRLQERLAPSPDTTLAFVPRTPNGQPLMKEFNAPNARVKPFIFRDKFNAKEFRTAAFRSKTFESKDFQSRDRDFRTGNALSNWRDNANPLGMMKDAGGVRSFETESAQETGETTRDGDRGYTTAPATMRGKSQKELDQQYTDAPALSIDQVRELLNKND